MVAKLEKRIERLEQRVKQIEKELGFGTVFIASFDWKDFSTRDHAILSFLLKKAREGATTTEIAEGIGLDSPETGGRTIVFTRLKRIERISRRLKGEPLVVTERKRWYLNYEEFDFPGVETHEGTE